MLKNRWLQISLLALLAAGVLLAWGLKPPVNEDSSRDTWVDNAGYLHVLGVVLGQSTLREAEVALKSRSDIALYIYPQEHPEAGLRLEAYFPSIADHSKVIAELDAGQSLLDELQQRATIPHLYPNKVARMNLHAEDIPTVQQLPVKKLTLIPSIRISEEMLTNRFGIPSTISSGSGGVAHYYFDDIGLHATLAVDTAARLEFRNPVK